MSRRFGPFLSATAASIALACAGLDYVKVPTPTQYSTWDDEDQERADEMEGVRYYLPRPFLHLKVSVPIAQRVAFVSFTYDPVNRVYRVDPPESPPVWLKRVLPKHLSVTQALAATLAGPVPGRTVAEEESATVGREPDDAAAKKKEEEPERPPSELTARTGFISDSDPVTRLSDLMDVVYLPDFEEQYVIQAKTGLGKGDIETRLRNGWAAEVFSQKVDNSNLIPYVIRQIERASEAAAGITTTWASLAATGTDVTSAAQLLAGAAAQESGTLGAIAAEPGTVKDFLGEIVLFKIAEVRVAQPGIYPILKPRELRYWLPTQQVVSGTDAQDRFELFLQQARVPWVRPDMVLVPAPPFTLVAFNTTTDVFIAPATDRISTATTPGQPGSLFGSRQPDPFARRNGAAGNVATIQQALAAKATSLEGEEAKLDLGTNGRAIAVEKDGVGSRTKITVRKKRASDTLTAEDPGKLKYGRWVVVALKVKGDQVSDIEFEPTAVVIHVAASIGELTALAGSGR